MAPLFEDYREIDNVRNRFDFLLELIGDPRRRVFITRRGEVLAVLLNPKDYDDLWWYEFDVDMKKADEDPVRYTNEEVMQRMNKRIRKQN